MSNEAATPTLSFPPSEAGVPASEAGAAAEARGFSYYKRLLSDLVRRVDEYIEENAAEAVAEDSWRKKLQRDMSDWARRAENRMVRMAESSRTANESHVSAVEAKVDELVAKVQQMADMVERNRTAQLRGAEREATEGMHFDA